MPDVSVRLADPGDRPVLERLWLMFRHDMSEFGGALPNPDGTFRDERLRAAFEDADRAPYLLACDGRPAGYPPSRAGAHAGSGSAGGLDRYCCYPHGRGHDGAWRTA